MNLDRILTAEDISKRIGCSVRQARKLLRGEVKNTPPPKVIPFGSRLLVRESVFEEWLRGLEESRMAPGGKAS